MSNAAINVRHQCFLKAIKVPLVDGLSSLPLWLPEVFQSKEEQKKMFFQFQFEPELSYPCHHIWAGRSLLEQKTGTLLLELQDKPVRYLLNGAMTPQSQIKQLKALLCGN